MQTDRYRVDMRTPTVDSALARNIDTNYASNVFALVGFAVALAVLGAQALLTDERSLIASGFAA